MAEPNLGSTLAAKDQRSSAHLLLPSAVMGSVASFTNAVAPSSLVTTYRSAGV